ncbi:hypothetical protein V1477_006946 [Vespula maculifrons]|uniref:Uncharacterized protein n=1 Tax=Vespula maculifrons TaxID=7453 RepID=A0ABD2CI64_VESMC
MAGAARERDRACRYLFAKILGWYATLLIIYSRSRSWRSLEGLEIEQKGRQPGGGRRLTLGPAKASEETGEERREEEEEEEEEDEEEEDEEEEEGEEEEEEEEEREREKETERERERGSSGGWERGESGIIVISSIFVYMQIYVYMLASFTRKKTPMQPIHHRVPSHCMQMRFYSVARYENVGMPELVFEMKQIFHRKSTISHHKLDK